MYKVLIVEDDPMVAMINEQFISRNPQFRLVGTRGDGDSALKFLEENDIDLLIHDIFMPQMNEIELVSLRTYHDVPESITSSLCYHGENVQPPLGGIMKETKQT